MTNTLAALNHLFTQFFEKPQEPPLFQVVPTISEIVAQYRLCAPHICFRAHYFVSPTLWIVGDKREFQHKVTTLLSQVQRAYATHSYVKVVLVVVREQGNTVYIHIIRAAPRPQARIQSLRLADGNSGVMVLRFAKATRA